MSKPIDFELQTDRDETFRFDAAYRAARVTILFFYRGFW